MTDQNHQDARAIGDAVVILPAEIDITNSDRMGEDLIAAIQPGITLLIADMTGTVFCDCSGMATLVRVHRAAADSGAELRLVTTARAVLRVFTLNDADRILRIYPSMTLARAPAQ